MHTLQIDKDMSFNVALSHIENAVSLSAVMHADTVGSDSNDMSRRQAVATIIENYFPELLAPVKAQMAVVKNSSELLAFLQHYTDLPAQIKQRPDTILEEPVMYLCVAS